METQRSNTPQHAQSGNPPRDRSAARGDKEDRPKTQRDMSHIQGWGADLDRRNRPAVPMERTPPRLDAQPGYPDDQPLRMKVYHSIERPGVTPVFGTSTPPSGLSGKMRDIAYRFSENDLRHWLLLLAADRVNVVEGIGQDLRRGHIPNLYAEMGGPAELQHNPAGFARKALIASAVIGAGYYLLRRRSARGARMPAR